MLDQLWKQRVIHRDIKGDNIMLDLSSDPFYSDFMKKDFSNLTSKTKFTLKLVDFGVSKSSEYQVVDTQIRGNRKYMAPETKFDDSPKEKCDLWSLGVFIFDMISPMKNHFLQYNDV